MNKIYTFDLVPSKNFKNKLIKVNAGSAKEAKTKLLEECNKLNKRFVKVRLGTEQELAKKWNGCVDLEKTKVAQEERQ